MKKNIQNNHEGVGAVSISAISKIPIVEHALFFLEHASAKSGIKITATGSLNRKFVQAFWDKHLSSSEDMPFRPTRERECPEATRIHCLLDSSKYVRKYKGTIRLTEKGHKTLEGGLSVELYRDLLHMGIFAWNWGFEDRYPEFEFIQDSARELISQLWKWPSVSVNASDFFNAVFEEFGDGRAPAEPNDDADDDVDDDADDEDWVFDSHEWIVRCFHLRFFQRFCVPFGILRNLTARQLFSERSDPYEKTEFFVTEFPNIVRG